MDAATLLRDLAARGVTVRADGTRLVVTPGRVLTDVDREAIRRTKAEIIVHLTGTCLPCRCTRWVFDLRLGCPHCQGAVCGECGGCATARYRREEGLTT